jgi:hypothetical protein
MEINPLNVEAQNNMALVLATSPETRVRNGTKAVELAERADVLTGNANASISATLAAAYAEAGQFPNAITTAKRALQLATDQGNTALADAIRAQTDSISRGFLIVTMPTVGSRQCNSALIPLVNSRLADISRSTTLKSETEPFDKTFFAAKPGL